MLIIPAIDLLGGKCVRLAQGDYARPTVYHVDPVEMALEFAQDGAEWVHVVDLDGAKAGAPVNLDLLERIVRESGLKVEFGGGVRTVDIAQELLGRGVARVVIGSRFAQNPELGGMIFARFGERAVAGIDARAGLAAAEGWTQETQIKAQDLAREAEHLGACRIVLTDIARDGMLSGPNIDFYLEVRRSVAIPMIQSGGIASLDDLRALRALGAEAPEAVIVGKATYEGKILLSEAILIQ